MKIIHRGRGDWWIGQQIRCNECGTVVETEDGDTVKIRVLPGLFGATTIAQIRCPVCEKGLAIQKPWLRVADDEDEDGATAPDAIEAADV